MKTTELLKLAFVFLLITWFSFSLWAQRIEERAVNLDSLTKGLTIASMILGLAIGVLQLYIATKLGKTEAMFNAKLSTIQKEMEGKFENELEKRELKFNTTLKEIEGKMATRQDIENIERLVGLQMDNIKMQIELALASVKKGREL
ncbi:MAG: hypothetical protein C4308_14205 [Chitinophagaceae bacterium]